MNNQTINELESKYGDAFFLLDEEVFVSNIEHVKSAFEKIYNNFSIAYSFKTNYIPRICRLALEQDCMAEVVSDMEYEHALRVGFQSDQIIFNGPIKSRDILFKSFENDSIVHFDSEAEIDYLEEYLSGSNRKPVRCALRVNFDMKGEKISRFGFTVEDGSVEKVYERLFQLEGCEPIGMHCHFQTATKTLDSFVERTQKIIDIAKIVFTDRKCEYLDIGGGFFGKMPTELKEQFTIKIPDYEEYASVISSLMLENFPKQDVKLIIEPGTMVVADTMKFYCTVNNIKFIGDKAFIIANGSIHNIKPNGRSRILPSLNVISMGKGKSLMVENADITGYTCIEDDFLAFDFNGEIAVGDFLEFSNVGAYSLMYKPPFIKGQAIILSKKGEHYSVIKNNESIDTIFSTYIY